MRKNEKVQNERRRKWLVDVNKDKKEEDETKDIKSQRIKDEKCKTNDADFRAVGCRRRK